MAISTVLRDECVKEVLRIQSLLEEILKGMGPYIDWKNNADDWSLREIVYHLIDLPAEGVHIVLGGILEGTTSEVSTISDTSNVTPARSAKTFAEVKGDLDEILNGLITTLELTNDAELANRTYTHNSVGKEKNTRNAQFIVERLFAGHWMKHVQQMSEVREQLQKTL